jgi:LytS/YehU family sensor histidine kinase
VVCPTLCLDRRKINITLIETEKEHEAQVKFMKSEYKALNALMNPHFIFNTLNNVQGLINRNDKVAANEYLRVFADLIRQNMHNISKELIPLQKEMDLVTNYLLLEKLRFRELLNYSIEVDDEVDLSDIMISPLLIQPLVENSLKHGILPMESADGYIKIRVYEKGTDLYIEVLDNGVGMAQSQKKPSSTHESFGLENIKKRIEQLSIIQNKNITFDIGEIRDSSGNLQWTVVTIKMPLTD